jgi:NAD dependent epimerase/dehydratase family enzyme
MRGAYNAVSPNPVTNKELTRELASALRRPLWLPPVPAFAVRLLAGEVAELVLKGGRISSEKIESTGFNFKFKTVRSAIEALYGGDGLFR